MGRLIDLTGKRFGRLMVVRQNGLAKDRNTLWLTRCECGKERTVRGVDLRTGRAKTCGCKAVDMSGNRYGLLVVISLAGTTKNGQTLWNVKCDCGNEKVTRGERLRSGETASCGCSHTKHGMCGTPEWNIWSAMIRRCENTNNHAYERYGGRGVMVCERWRESFQAFYDDMGPRPSKGHSIDRIDNDGDYEPSNCRWATAKEQASNKRTNRILTFRNRSLNLNEWAKTTGFCESTIWARLNRGWSVEKALTVPLVKV